MINRIRPSRRVVRRNNSKLRLRPAIETVEPRIVLSTVGFLQGTVYANPADTTPLANATVSLYPYQSTTTSPLQTVTTSTTGSYVFTGLTPGNYTIVETPPTGYANDGTSINSPLTTTLSTTSSSINVTVYDLSDVSVNYDSGNPYNTSTSTGAYGRDQGAVNVVLDGSNLGGTAIGQVPVTVSVPSGPTTTEFSAYCLNVSQSLNLSPDVFPAISEPLSSVAAIDNAGAIGFLYESYGSTLIPTNSAATPPTATQILDSQALQLAIWKLEYDTGSNLQSFSTGNFQVPSLYTQGVGINNNPLGLSSSAAAFSALISQASTYVSQALTASSNAIFLNAQNNSNVPNSNPGYQDLVAPESLNFTNNTAATISGEVYSDTNANGQLDNGEVGVTGGSVTLTGSNSFGAITPIVEPIAANGTYSFTGLLPGTYTVTETTLPTGYVATGSDVGTVNGTADGTSTSSTLLSSISVGAGQSAVSENFGVYAPATISGEVYNDVNANGLLNNGEVGITGGSVTLTGTNVNGTITPIVESISSTGTYSFTGLLPGTYTVTETTLPTGYVATGSDVGTVNGTLDGTSTSSTLLSSISVGAGQSAVSENFGVYAPATISGEVYNDFNANGLLNNGEVGITGGSVTLTGTNVNGTITPIVESISSTGTYSFTGLLPGTYTVTETTLPTGYVATGSDVGTVNGTADGTSTSSTLLSSISVGAGQSAVSENFGVYAPATISGEVYTDANADGQLDNGETGLTGSTVTLTGTTTTGVAVSISEPVGANGTYSFTGLVPGTYTVTDSNIPAGYTPVASNVGTVGGTADGTSTSSTVLGGISLAGGQSSINDDFGDILLSCCNVSFFQFQVTTPTGQVTVVPTLTGNVAEGDTVQAFFVIPSGYEQLSLVSYNAPEPYYVMADGALQTIYQSSTGIYGPGVWGLPAITIPNNFYQIDFVCGPALTNANNYSPTSPTNKLYSAANGGTNPQGSGVVSISGEVYNDANDNDALNTGETGVAGDTVTLTGTDAYGTAISVTTTTNASGQYSFTSLPFSSSAGYTVTAAVPTGDFSETANVGTVSGATDGTAGTEVISNVVLASSTQTTGINYNFPVTLPNTISGEVYNDANGDGSLDNGETGLAGETVTLTGTTSTGVVITPISETVASNGTYSFTGVAPGTYTVTESNIPTGYSSVASNVGTVGGTADGSSTSSTVLSTIKVTSGQSAINEDFGDILLSCCSLTFLGFAVTTPSGNVYDTPDLRNDTAQGDTVEAVFTIPTGQYEQLTLEDFNAAEPFISANNPQTLYQAATGVFGPGTHVLTVTIPNNFYQIDFICGAPLSSGPNLNADIGGTNPQGSGVLSISGEVYNDANANDALNTGETGIAGDTVTLTGTDAYGNAISFSTTTNASGQYTFAGLPFSSSAGYTVTAAVPTGYYSETANVGTVSGATDGTAGTEVISKVVLASSTQTTGINYNFPVTPPSTISGEVYNDANGNGLLDSGETGLAGETVTLTGTTSTGAAITPISETVASNGTYSFTGLAPGTYTVTESNIPTGYTSVASHVGTVGGTLDGTSTSSTVLSTIKVTSGQSAINEDFGDILLTCCNVSVLNPVYDVYNPATGTNSWVRSLSGATQEGDTVTTYFTVPAGTYEQLSLVSYNAPEPYYVAADANLQTVYQSATGIFGPGLNAFAVTIPNNFYQIDFVCGPVLTNLSGSNNYSFSSGLDKLYGADNGGTNPQGSGVLSISGEVYTDVNGNDALDSGETGVSGDAVTITGTDAYGIAYSLTTTTNSSGQYTFTNLPFSNSAGYTVTATVPTGDLSETANVGKVSGGTDGTAGTEVVSNIVLATSSQTTGTGYNFAVAPAGTISGEVYNDVNGDGVLDSGSGSGVYLNGEVGLAGETITLTGTTNAGQAVSVSEQVSSTGTYSFTGVLPGMYTLTESNIPSGFVSTGSNPGTINGGLDGVSSSATMISAVGVGSGRYTGVNYNFGNVQTSTIAGEVYADANGDGHLDSGDSGVGGETITLTGTTNSGKSVSISEQVPSSGTYSFSGLLPGLYTLTESNIPSGYIAEVSNPGTINGGLDGVSSSATVIGAVGVGSGRYTGVSYNFGVESQVCSNQVKSCSWWTTTGQNLIENCNGSVWSTNLGNWLAKTCPSTFGCLSGKTNLQVASYLDNLSSWTWLSSYDGACAELLSTALNAYVCNSSLAGNVGVSYGFSVTSNGLSNSCYNVGSNGSAMGMSNNTSYNVITLLTACDAKLGANTGNSSVIGAVENIFGGICGI